MAMALGAPAGRVVPTAPGEVLGLQRKDTDLLHGTVTVRRAVTVDSSTGHVVVDLPKTEAAKRTVTIPPNVITGVISHLEDYAGPVWLFPGAGDSPAHPRTLSRVWASAWEAAGRPDVTVHDLRHSGATWLAISGATTAELQHRVGHASPVAAARYQHATQDRDRALAEALGAMASGVTPIPAESVRNRRNRKVAQKAQK
jgi:integrase